MQCWRKLPMTSCQQCKPLSTSTAWSPLAIPSSSWVLRAVSMDSWAPKYPRLAALPTTILSFFKENLQTCLKYLKYLVCLKYLWTPLICWDFLCCFWQRIVTPTPGLMCCDPFTSLQQITDVRLSGLRRSLRSLSLVIFSCSLEESPNFCYPRDGPIFWICFFNGFLEINCASTLRNWINFLSHGSFGASNRSLLGCGGGIIAGYLQWIQKRLKQFKAPLKLAHAMVEETRVQVRNQPLWEHKHILLGFWDVQRFAQKLDQSLSFDREVSWHLAGPWGSALAKRQCLFCHESSTWFRCLAKILAPNLHTYLAANQNSQENKHSIVTHVRLVKILSLDVQQKFSCQGSSLLTVSYAWLRPNIQYTQNARDLA